MAKTGGAVQKLRDKSNHKATALRMGTHKPIIARTMTPYAEKTTAYREHVERILNGSNPSAVETFRGDGLPDEVISGSKNWAEVKPPKTNAERAKEDKRNRLKDEMVPGWRPSRYVREDDVV